MRSNRASTSARRRTVGRVAVVLLIALAVPLAAAAGGTPTARIHSPILVYDEPPRIVALAPARPSDGGPSDARAATTARGLRGTDPCRRDGYHDNVMAHGLDTARTKCERYRPDTNDRQLSALSGEDPSQYETKERRLDRGPDLFGVPNNRSAP